MFSCFRDRFVFLQTDVAELPALPTAKFIKPLHVIIFSQLILVNNPTDTFSQVRSDTKYFDFSVWLLSGVLGANIFCLISYFLRVK